MTDAALHGAGWPVQVRDIAFESPADGTLQPMVYYAPPAQDTPAPLLVGLHTWSGDYRQVDGANYARWAIEAGWAMVHPDFRGPNRRPEAAGSDLAVSDVWGAVEYACQHANIDDRKIYLCGVSGGGHMALLLAGRMPEVWAAVSAWVPIVDLAAWHGESLARGNSYADDLVGACSGLPGASASVDSEYSARSPLTYLDRATAPLDINAGIRDGHDGSVPISHALRAFNAVADPADRIGEVAIRDLVQQAVVPPHLTCAISDSSYGHRPPLLRRQSRHAHLTLYDGDHEIVYPAALRWLGGHSKP